jgi:hypothetical protein
VLELTDYLCDNALSRGWEVFSSRETHEKSGIVSLIHPTLPPDDALKVVGCLDMWVLTRIAGTCCG